MRGREDAGVPLWIFFVLAAPALAYYPLELLHTFAERSSLIWRFAASWRWVFMLCPLTAVMIGFFWRRQTFHSRGQRLAALVLALLTAFTALLAVPMLSILSGL